MDARLPWLLSVLVGCAAARPAVMASPPPPPPAGMANAPGAPPPPSPAFAPDEIWIHRTLALDDATGARLTVATLARDRGHARLVIESRAAPLDGHAAADLAWQTTAHHTYEGDVVVDTPARLELRLVEADTGLPYPFACRRVQRHDLAPAAATRVRDPGFHGACGNPGAWSAPATQRAAVLACGPADEDDYAPAPGLETVAIVAACAMHGGGDRLIGDDGAIAPPGTVSHMSPLAPADR